MSLPLLPSAVHSATERLSTGKALKQLLRNTRQVTRNTGGRLLQDPAALKSNSLIVSSLILVISRIIVANISALRAKGSPEGPYRYRESIRTTIREICGWTFGFAVLRQFQKLVSWGMRKTFGIKLEGPPQPPSTLRQLKESILKSVRRTAHVVPPLAPDPALGTRFVYNESGAARKFLPLLQKIPGLGKMAPKALMQSLYHWAPIVIGSVPAVFLAGYALERFTRDHSDRVVNFISRHFNPQALKSTNPNATPPQKVANQTRFDAFMSQVHTKQAERGML